MMPPSDVNNNQGPPSAAENPGRALQPRVASIHPVAVPHAPPTLAAAPNAISLLRALRRRLGLALAVGLPLAVAVAVTVWYLLPPPKITARMQLHVAPVPPSVLFDQGSNAPWQQAFLSNQTFIIHDRFVLTAALRDPEVANLSLIKDQADPVQWLEDHIGVEFPSTEYMRITLSGDRPQEQIKIVSAITHAYLDNVVDKEKIEREAKRKKLEALQRDLQQRWNAKKDALKALQMQAGATNEDGVILVQQIAQEELLGVKKQIAEVRYKLLLLSVELGLHPDWQERIWPSYAAALNCLPGPGVPVNQALVGLLHDDYLVALASPNSAVLNERELDDLISKHPDFGQIQKQIHDLRGKIEIKRDRLKPQAFEEQAKKDIQLLEALESAEQEQRKKLKPKLALEMRRRLHLTAQGERTARDSNYRSLKVLESELVRRAEELGKKCLQKVKDASALMSLIEEMDEFKKLMQRTSDNLIRMDVEREAPSRITLTSKEAVLYTPDSTKRKLMITGGSALAALALVLLAFSWFEFQSRKVYSPDEVVLGLGLNIVGTVPDHSPRGWLPWSRGSEINPAYTQSMLTESVDTARTILLHAARQDKLQIVMITSALAGEGKTSLASHLAASLARAGQRTILVDSDLRNPTLHRLFERERVPGMSEYLRGEVDLAAITLETSIPNLWLIPAGKADGVALQALAFDVVGKLFEYLRLHYDFVVVDSCPVLPVADAMLVGEHVDAVIFSLLREVSRMPRVHAAYQRLAVLGIRMLGAVVNGTQHDRYPAYDYHYVLHDDE